MNLISVNDLKSLPRDGALVEKVKSVLSNIAASKKLKEGESLILHECIEHCCPYPAYLLEKLSLVCGNSNVTAVLMEEWKAFEQILVEHLLGVRSTSKAIMDGIVDEGLAAKKLKKGEALTIREGFEDNCDSGYPDFVLSKLSDSHKSFLVKEKALYFEALDLLTRYVAGKF
ncbi:hypothetical protein EON65_02705 [archaeon]|nr:MAG: hypothetical protein EON65_02705 [archaeon]